MCTIIEVSLKLLSDPLAFIQFVTARWSLFKFLDLLFENEALGYSDGFS